MTGNYDEAEASYSKALELAPDYAELHASIGVLAIVQGNHTKAIEHLERAIELDSSLAVAYSNLAIAYASVGRFDDANQQLDKDIKRGYDQPEVIRARIEKLRKQFNPE